MSWLDKFFNTGYATVQIAGIPLPQERTLNIVSGASGTDDPAFNRTNLNIQGGVPGTSQFTFAVDPVTGQWRSTDTTGVTTTLTFGSLVGANGPPNDLP
jgi:hypothetical protein